jgi:DNA-binding MarR family transcriptional regulator
MPEHDYIAELGPLALASRLRRLLQRMQSDGEQVYRSLNLEFKPKWFPVLHLLSHRSPLTLMEMAQLLSITHPSVIETANELILAGLIVSRKSQADARRSEHSLTREGENLCNYLRPVWDAFRAAGEEAVSGGDHDFLKALEAFEQRLDEQSMYERVMSRLETWTSKRP